MTERTKQRVKDLEAEVQPAEAEETVEIVVVGVRPDGTKTEGIRLQLPPRRPMGK